MTGNNVAVDYFTAKARDDELRSLVNLPADGSFLSKIFEGKAKLLGGTALALVLSTSATLAADIQNSVGYNSQEPTDENRAFISQLVGLLVGELGGFAAGLLTGLVSFGALAIPTQIIVSEKLESFGIELGERFYDTFTETANWLAEYLAPLLAPVGTLLADVGGALVNFLSEVFTAMRDFVFASDGLFGIDGPLFGEDGPLHAVSDFLTGEGFLTDEGTWAHDGLDAILYGTDGGDVLIHEGWGEAYGGAGGDTLIGLNPIFIKQGDPLFDVTGSPLAQKDESLLLDAGDGGDWVLVFGGERATAIGGAGRDWIFNTSVNGIVYGDTYDGLSSSGAAENWEATTTGANGKLTYTHCDKIWFWGGTTMMDPTKADQLAFFGYPLVGGTNDLSAFMGSVKGTPLGAGLTIASTANPFYFDYLVPFIVYYVDSESRELKVANMLSLGLGDLFFGSDVDTDAGSNLPFVMTFKNFDEAVGTYWGGDVAAQAIYSITTGDASNLSDMGTIFKKANPALALFSLIPGFPGGINRMLPMIDDLLMKAGATILIARSLGWETDNSGSSGGGGNGGGGGGGGNGGGNGGGGGGLTNGVLTLALSGQALQSVSIDAADVWFDLDGDLFAEKTGWLKGDDGFLVRDLNGDGKITDINEMFGGPGESGLADLAQHDANGDGRLTAADAIYAELKVWRDRDGDGVTDAGEMVSLAEIGWPRRPPARMPEFPRSPAPIGRQIARNTRLPRLIVLASSAIPG